MNVIRMLAALSLVLIWTCASERAISGGPEDKEAPTVLFSTPENESVDVELSPDIFIKFSEQMKKSTFTSALQIWPRPPGGYKLKSGWTWLKISFNKPLEKDITYLLTLDKSVQDLRGNALEATYILAFSTGKKLNSGSISGFIHGSKAVQKNGDIFLYRQFNLPLDELIALPADYIFQPDDDGSFELPYLAEQSYMLFYHWDRNRNKVIDGDDYFARPENASIVACSDSLKPAQKLWPHLIPLNHVKLLDASALTAQFIQIRTNRPANLESLDQIELIADGQGIPILGASLTAEDEYAMHFNIAIPIIDGARVWLKNFQDTSGITLHSDTLEFKNTTAQDSLKFEKLQVFWQSGNSRRFPEESSKMRIRSSLPFTFKSDSAFQVINPLVDSLMVPGSLQKISSMEWEFSPDTTLAAGETFHWKVEARYIYSVINHQKLDSLMQGQLFTVSEDSLGSLRVIQQGGARLKCELKGGDITRFFQLESGKPYLLDQLPARRYFLTAYEDQNGNDHYDSGGLGAVSGSEPFYVYPDEIRIRARWETDLGEWKLD